ncbi:hypothetical protein I4U23_010599 [Adineta vaga]|nr:hypothetical protein I4U23_010599 [Adineta vaga]
MYNTNHLQNGYCLLYYVPNDTEDYDIHEQLYVLGPISKRKTGHQVIPYCFRPSDDIFTFEYSNFTNTMDSSFTFAQLEEKNISSQTLLSWSASIDLAEHYEIFLNNQSNSSLSLFDNEVQFYNCTPPWFGPLCRFAFDLDNDRSFAELVVRMLKSKDNLMETSRVTCYTHLNCQTSYLCLDWREICDRKIDCLDASDELNCWQLEINECNENEYRCYNGQCIPKEFFHDGLINPDCLDRTDEPSYFDYPKYCSDDPSMRCEEHACRPGEEEFTCGDGTCMREISIWSMCKNGRDNLLIENDCARAMACLMRLHDRIREWCDDYCMLGDCVKDKCPSLYQFPSNPILFGHVRFLFMNDGNQSDPDDLPLPVYVCYNEELCEDFLTDAIYINGSACQHFNVLGLDEIDSDEFWDTLVSYVKDRFRVCLVMSNETYYINYTTMYHCENSTKFISKHRLVDGIQDCPLHDDETFNQSCSLRYANYRFSCSVNNSTMCVAPLNIQDGKKDCPYGEDEYRKQNMSLKTHIYFQKICDGIEELLPILIDGQNETDETECIHWQCNNTYTRCDGYWSCEDGADEFNCLPWICPDLHQSCIFLNDTSRVSCLPISQVNDDIIDCLGATDERNYCQSVYLTRAGKNYYCQNDKTCISSIYLCNGEKNCPSGDDESSCTSEQSFNSYGYCEHNLLPQTGIESFLTRSFCDMILPRKIYFTLRDMPIYPLQLMTENITLVSLSENKTQVINSNNEIDDMQYDNEWRCNRGLLMHVRVDNETDELVCLCSPSYYGDMCQYQNQRVSLTFQIRVTSDWRTLFTFLITLIDDEENIESHDYIEYLAVRDCDTKFNIYLLYSTRPKNISKTYSVRIDAYNKLTLTYRASWIFPLQFSFLPVHRLSLLLIIPISAVEPLKNHAKSCFHGRRFHYVNNQSLTFCQCEHGWSGNQCSTKYTCKCASHSLCINNFICICSLNHFGPRCYLHHSSCHSQSCTNSGQCVPTDERYIDKYLNKSTCICSEEYYGDRCQYRQTRIDISFHKTLTIPQSLLVHFITIEKDVEPIRRSLMKHIAFDQNSLLFYISTAFNIAFVEIFNNYYLIILREQRIISVNLSTKIMPSFRCASIHDLFNNSFANQHLLKRIKSYHIPCQKRLELVCFYDDIHFCLCDLNRRSNCFEFEHNLTNDCHGQNSCENGGQCFTDDPKCPTSSICVCPECFYGSRCQFSTKGSTFSLDTILGYQIRPNIGIIQQSLIVHITTAVTTIVFVLGFVNSFSSFLTFQRETICNVGCGFYLLTFSITSMITIIILTFKFWILLASQMNWIQNRWFLRIQCISIDFLLRFVLSTGDWLSACVATERAVNVLKGIYFNKVKSKQYAKWMVLFVLLFTITTHIHDPIYRNLIDDKEEQRTWCIVKYSTSIQMYDWALNILHFSVPFAINCISALVIIVATARTRSNIQKTQSYKKILHEQFQHHKHLLISPFILILLALPRLIISFLSGCMKSARNPWLYLIGYFISFIPSTLIFAVFVLPSKIYMKGFKESIKRFW